MRTNVRQRIVVLLGALGLLWVLLCFLTFGARIRENWHLSILDSTDIVDRRRAAAALAELKSSRAVPALIAIIRRENPEDPQSHYAGRALLRIGEAAVLPLLETLDPDRDDNFAQMLLWNIGPEAIPQFSLALSHSKATVRRWAACLLGQFGSKNRTAVPALAQVLLHDCDPEVRFWAATTLGVLSPSTDEIPAIMGVIRNRQEAERTRMSTAHSLGCEAGISALQELLGDDDPYVRLCAAASLSSIANNPRALSVLERAREDASLEVRRIAQGTITFQAEQKRASKAGPCAACR
jgi:HEAT repeat protein